MRGIGRQPGLTLLALNSAFLVAPNEELGGPVGNVLRVVGHGHQKSLSPTASRHATRARAMCFSTIFTEMPIRCATCG